MIRLRETSALRKPARTLRQRATNEPDKKRSVGAENHDPAPAIETQHLARNEKVGEHRRDRDREKSDRLFAGKGAAAHLSGHELRDVGADGDQLDGVHGPDPECPRVLAWRKGPAA